MISKFTTMWPPMHQMENFIKTQLICITPSASQHIWTIFQENCMACWDLHINISCVTKLTVKCSAALCTVYLCRHELSYRNHIVTIRFGSELGDRLATLSISVHKGASLLSIVGHTAVTLIIEKEMRWLIYRSSQNIICINCDKRGLI